MNTCKTCKHWDKPELLTPKGYGVCQHRCIAESGDEDERRTDQLVYVYSESGYFSTGPDFGCMHWEKVLTIGGTPDEPTPLVTELFVANWQRQE